MRDRQTAKIRDAFAFFEFSVSVQTGLDLQRRELIRDAFTAALEILQILGRPPVVQITVAVELRPLIVEPVRQLVPDHSPHASIIDCIIGMEIEPSLNRFLSGMPSRLETATGNPRLNGVLVEADDKTGLATDIERLSYSLQDLEGL